MKTNHIIKTLTEVILITITIIALIVTVLAGLTLTNKFTLATIHTNALQPTVFDGSLVFNQTISANETQTGELVILGDNTTTAQPAIVADVTQNGNYYTITAFTDNSQTQLVTYNTTDTVNKTIIKIPLAGHVIVFFQNAINSALFVTLMLIFSILYVQTLHRRKPATYIKDETDYLAVLQEIFDNTPEPLSKREKKLLKKQEKELRKQKVSK